MYDEPIDWETAILIIADVVLLGIVCVGGYFVLTC